MFVQIVKFKLKPEISRGLFLCLDLTAQMMAWFKHRDGFVAYELYEGYCYWFDRIAWLNENLAEDGLSGFFNPSLTSSKKHHYKSLD